MNAAIRQKLKAQGELATSITINAMMKGDYASTELEIATGDKVVFGENLEVAGIAINNGDIAHVTAITKAAGIDPVLHFRLDRRDSEGRPITFEAKPRDLVGYRKDRQLRIPRLQHAYAVTVHGAQGATVDHAILVCTARTSAEQVLLGMTRHRFGLDVFVAADRLLPQEMRRFIRLKKDGEIVNIDIEQTLAALSPAQEAQAIRGFIREASERENKLNPSDFVQDVHAWLDEPDAVTGFRRWQQPTSLDVFKGRLNRLSQKPPVPKIALNGIASDSFNASELAAIEAAHQKDRCQMMNIAHDHEPSAAAAMAIGQNPMRTPQERTKTLGRLATRTKTAIRDKLQLWVLNPIASALKRVDEGDRARRTARPRPTFKFAPGMMLACQLQIATRQIEEAQALENMTRRMARRRSMLVALLADPAAQTKSRQSEVQPLGQPTPSLGATSEPHRQSPMVGDVETRHPAKSGRNKSWIANGFEKLASVGRELINRTTTTAAEATLRKPPNLTDSKKAAAILDPQRRAESPVERVVHAPAGSKTAPQPGATLAETDGRRQKSSSDGFWMPPAEDVFVFDPVSGRLVPAGQVSLSPASYGREGVDVQSVRKDSLIVSSNSLRPPQIPADARVDPAVIPKGHEAAKRPAATPARPSSGPLKPAWKRKDDGRGM